MNISAQVDQSWRWASAAATSNGCLTESGAPHRIAPPGDTAAITTALSELIAAVRGGAGFDSSHDPHRFSRESITGRLAVLLDETRLPHRHAAFVAEGVTS